MSEATNVVRLTDEQAQALIDLVTYEAEQLEEQATKKQDLLGRLDVRERPPGDNWETAREHMTRMIQKSQDRADLLRGAADALTGG